MSFGVATLYRVLSDDSKKEECKIHFPSTTGEEISHYLYVINNHGSGPTITVSAGWQKQEYPLAAILHAGHNSLELEARCEPVWIKAYPWINKSFETSYVRLPSSTPAKQFSRFLVPDEPFRIGDFLYLLQADRVTPTPDVQVMSSRPGNDDAEAPIINDQDPESRLDHRPSTPNPRSGTAVLETPVAQRHQNPPEPSDSPINFKIRDSTQVENDQVLATEGTTVSEQDNKDKAENIIDLESKSATVQTNLGIPANDDASSQTTESSSEEIPCSNILERSKAEGVDLSNDPRISEPRTPTQQSPHKRPLSSIDANEDDNDDVGESVLPITSPLVTPAAGSTNHEGPPRKRQRRVSTVVTEESQNSVKSTIHVELPPTTYPLAPSDRSSLKSGHDVKQSQGSSGSTFSTPRNSIRATEPPSSNISNRSTRQGQREQTASQDQVIKVVFASSSHVGGSTAYTKFFRQYNIKQVKNMNDCDILCTGKDEVKRTSKLLLAILRGKEVVTDQWITRSVEQKKLLDTAGFVPEDPVREREWGTSLSDAIKRGQEGLEPFEGWTINFTPSAKKELGKSWSELKEICLVAGATAVQAMIPRKSPADTDATIMIAASNEADQATLEERGWRVYNKDIITFSALRGGIDADSNEFLIVKKGNGSAAKKKGPKKAR
ncbi:MAG: hypothetical protein Q9209_003705 [Squamulea sp. 1 TL-2023]